MFNDESFAKLWDTPGMTLNKLRAFKADKKLTEPMSIINDSCMQFGEYESYPMELAEVIYYNGF